MHVPNIIPKLKLNLVRLMESTNVTLTQEKIPDIQRLRIQGSIQKNLSSSEVQGENSKTQSDCLLQCENAS